MNIATLAKTKADNLNNTPGKLSDFDCTICKNKGFVFYTRDNNVFSKECSCMGKRRSLRRIKASGLMSLLQTHTFEAYETPEKWQVAAKKKACTFSDDPANQWFFIAGTPGTGKTHLCTAIAGKLLESGREVRYMLWREEAPKLKAAVTDRELYENEMQKWKKTGVLYIDDFFKGGVTEADKNLAFEILNARYISPDAVTIISSEKSIEKILEIDEAIGSRIYERSKNFCIKTPAQNWRLKA